MSAKLWVAGYDVIEEKTGINSGRDHAYVFYDHDGDLSTRGDQKIIRGGPKDNYSGDKKVIAYKSDPDVTSPNIIVELRDVAINSYDYRLDEVTPADQDFRLLLSGASASNAFNQMWIFAQSLGDPMTDQNGLYESHVDYGLLGPNSNSVINSVLNSVGLNFRVTTPYQDGSITTYQDPSEYPGHMGLLDGSGDNSFTAYVYEDGSTETTVFHKRNGNDTIILEWNNFTDAHAELEIRNENTSTGLTTVYFDRLNFEDVDFEKSGETLKVTRGINPFNDDLLRVIGFYSDLTNNAAEGAQVTAFEFEDLVYRQGDKNDNVLDASGSIKKAFLEGFEGNDILTGGAGEDRITGGADDDVIDGGAGNDTLIGGMGKDTYRDSFGFDTISYADDPNAIKVEARTITDGYGDVDEYGWIEQINGTSFDDEIFVNTNSQFQPGQLFDAGEGTDILIAKADMVVSGNTIEIDGAITAVNFEIIDTNNLNNQNTIYIQDLGRTYKSGGIYDYSGLGRSISANFRIGEITDGIEVDHVSTGGDIVGTDYGDTLTLNGNSSATLGLGNDTAYLESSNYITYCGGDDVVYAQKGVSHSIPVLFMEHKIKPEDVLITQTNWHPPDQQGREFYDLYVEVNNRGSITIKDLFQIGDNNNSSPDIAFSNGQYFDKNYELQSYNPDDTGFRGNPYDKLGTIGVDVGEYYNGGHGDDILTAIDGRSLLGGTGNDVLHGTDQLNYILGQFGDDEIFGYEGNDILDGGLGNDEIKGGEGNDVLYGGFGNDILEGGEGNDTIYGGSSSTFDLGNDTVVFTSSINNYIIDPLRTFIRVEDQLGSDGSDFVAYDVEYFDFGGDLIAAESLFLNWVIASENGETIAGTASSDLMVALQGDDTLFGGAGDDILLGSGGYDIAEYSGLFSSYTINNNTPFWEVSDNLSNEGTDTLFEIETLKFADGIYDLTSSTFTLDDDGSSNARPVANDDSFSVNENDFISNNVSGNDSDPDDDFLSVSLLSDVSNGILTLSSDGAFTFLPDTDYFGADSFTYTLSDGEFTDTATVSLTVNEVIDPPTGSDAPTLNLAVLEDGGVSFGSRADGAETNLASTTQKIQAVSFETGNDVSSAQVIYEQGGTSRGLNLFIDAGKLYAAVWNKLEENWGYKELSHDVQANTKYTAALVMNGALPADGSADLYVNGTLVDTINGVGNLYAHSGNIGVGMTPDNTLIHNATVSNANFTGSIEKLAHYNGGLSAADLEQLNDYLADNWLETGPANTAPVANDDSIVGDEDTDISGNVLGNDSDPDGDALSVSVLSNVSNGSLVLNTDGTFTYTPNADYFGSDSFTYTLSDSDLTDTATVNITINDVAEPPTTPEAPTQGLALLLDNVGTTSSLPDNTLINTSDQLAKTHALSFETGNDITTTQVIYEQGGATRGLNMFIQDGNLYSAVWNRAEENWGYKELDVAIGANKKYTASIVMDGALPSNGTATLYLNGAEVGSANGVGQLYAHADNIGIGEVQGGTYINGSTLTAKSAFTGTIDKLAHYNEALDGATLNQLHDYMADGWLSGGPTAPTEQIIMEFGSVNADHNAVTVNLSHTFNNPVVFMTMTSINDDQIVVPRITDIQDDAFTFYAQEADYLDGSHAVESFSYIVLESGSWELSDGTKLEVGSFDTNVLSRNGFEDIAFASDFASDPAILTQVQTDNDTSFVATRQKNVDANGFDVALQEEELYNEGSHGVETIGWFAIEKGTGSDDGFDFAAGATGDTLTHNVEDVLFDDAFDQLPQLLANISSNDGSDASFVRVDNLDTNGFDVQIQEDQSKDTETNHISETLDYFAIAGAGQLTGTDNSGVV